MNKLFFRPFLVGLLCVLPVWVFITLIDLYFFRFIFIIAIFWAGLTLAYLIFFYFTTIFNLMMTFIQFWVTGFLLITIIGLLDVIISYYLQFNSKSIELTYSIFMLFVGLTMAALIKIVSDKIIISYGYKAKQSRIEKFIV